MACPYCGEEGFVANLPPEESTCPKCGAVFYGSDKPANLLKCPNRHCGRAWIYKGKKAYPAYTSCPSCKSSVRCPSDL
jgi:DNA-directed RNA polymerase subunit RPC12/RpoP